MQLTHAIALLTAAATVAATPVDIEARQGVPRVRATFYNNGGYCGPPQDWREDTVFVQDPPPFPGVCHDLTVGPFSATYFNESSITRTFRFYNQPCGNLGNANYFDLSPSDGATPGCKALAIRSWVVL